MLLAFSLRLSGVSSWNGKWSGEGKAYARVLKLSDSKTGQAKAAQILADAPYVHCFGDGWQASIDVQQVDAKEARRVRKVSCGFCSYDWMIENIRFYGSIEKPEKLAI